jgi:hypothetical protein
MCANLGWRERDEGVQLEPSSYSLASKDGRRGRAMPGALIITTVTIKEQQSTTPAT